MSQFCLTGECIHTACSSLFSKQMDGNTLGMLAASQSLLEPSVVTQLTMEAGEHIFIYRQMIVVGSLLLLAEKISLSFSIPGLHVWFFFF